MTRKTAKQRYPERKAMKAENNAKITRSEQSKDGKRGAKQR